MKKCLIILGACLLLTGCSSTTSQKETESPTTTESVTEMSSSEVVSEDTEVLPNSDNLKKKLNEGVSVIGVQEVSNLYFDNINKIDSDTIFADVIIKTELYELKFHCSYHGITGSWIILYIENNDSQHTYYILPGNEDSVDLYDYSTDTLISKKKENSETKDVVKDFNEKMESLNEEQESDLNRIADEYNIKR